MTWSTTASPTLCFTFGRTGIAVKSMGLSIPSTDTAFFVLPLRETCIVSRVERALDVIQYRHSIL
jgi:hypothetical protein